MLTGWESLHRRNNSFREHNNLFSAHMQPCLFLHTQYGLCRIPLTPMIRRQNYLLSTSLINRSFSTGHKLRKIFNRNTLKLSYSCMPNVKQLIDGHNKAILKNAEIAQPRQDEEKKCNCRKKEECSLDGECLVNENVYQATVKTKDTKETYIGLTANQFKARYRNHQMSFRQEKRNTCES